MPKYYETKNFLVKAVDCTAWLHSEFWQEYSKIVFKSEDHVVISCKRDFLTLLNKINPVIVIDDLPDDKKTNWIRQQIFFSRILKRTQFLFRKITITRP